MGTQTIPDRTAGQTILKSWMNLFRSVLCGDLVPRGQNGAPRANYARLGTSVYQWKNAFIQKGYFGAGDVAIWMDYAGEVVLPQGWMLCNGVIVNEANYDTQHVAGDWDEYIVTSPLSGLYLPNMNDNHPLGATSTLQAGTIAITTTGSNTQDLSHNHGSPRTTSAAPTQATNVNNVVDGNKAWTYVAGHTHSVTIPTALTSNNIEPDSYQVKFIMRVI